MTTPTHQCPVCSLHYLTEELADACEKFCNENNACSVEIIKHSVEAAEKPEPPLA